MVLVARHPTAPLPLPSGVTWRLSDGAVDTRPRDGDRAQAPAGTVKVEIGDGTVQVVSEGDLPAVLRAALDAGQAIRRVQPVRDAAPDTAGDITGHIAGDDPAEAAGAAPRRAGAAYRVLHGAVHRARLLASSQWFLAPAMLFLFVLGIVYASDAGPPLQAAAVTAITLVPALTWLSVLAHRVDGRELARAFAAHAGGRGRAHLATDLGLVPFAVLLALAALVAPLISQGSHPHTLMLDVRIVALHLAAAVFGAGLGSLLALIERAGWRLLTAVAAFLVLFVVRDTPMGPLLRLSTHPTTLQTTVGGPAAWLCLPGLALVAVAAFTRLTRPGGSALDAGVGAVEAALELRVRDLEAGRAEHRLEEPAEGAELGADVFGVVLAGVPLGGIRRGVPEPVLEDLLGLGRPEIVDQVAQPQYPAGPQHPRDPVQGYRLPEVGQLVQGMPGVHGVGRRPGMLSS